MSFRGFQCNKMQILATDRVANRHGKSRVWVSTAIQNQSPLTDNAMQNLGRDRRVRTRSSGPRALFETSDRSSPINPMSTNRSRYYSSLSYRVFTVFQPPNFHLFLICPQKCSYEPYVFIRGRPSSAATTHLHLILWLESLIRSASALCAGCKMTERTLLT